MKRLTINQKVEALNNALRSYKFDEKYFIQKADARLGQMFSIAEPTENGGLNTITRFMTYDEMNAYLQGYEAARQYIFSQPNKI